MVPWILASMALDRLPFWVALPVGLGSGFALGSWLASPERGALGWVIAVLVLGVIAVLGVTAPRAVASEPLSPPTRAERDPLSGTPQPDAPRPATSQSDRQPPAGDELLV